MRITRFITICVGALIAMAIAPALAMAAPGSIVDDDFAGGTSDANAIVVPPGSVELATEGLPADWTVTPWTAGGTANASAGVLTVDGALAGPTTTFSAPQTLTFTATFGTEALQNVGFGVDFNNGDWAMFSTGGGPGLELGLYARTNVGGTQIDQRLDNAPPNIDPVVPHNYRIEWDATEVRFYVDNALVSTQTATLPANLRVLASDLNPNGTPLTVEDVNLAPIPSGTFTSRVFEAERRITSWGALTAEGTLDGVTFATRTGNAPTPDPSWSGFQPLGPGGAVQSPVRRYIQYQAVLASDATSTPSIERVTLAYDYDAAAPSVVLSGVTVSGTTATATFSSPDADVAQFECSLDSGPFVVCTSSRAYTNLSPGSHRVRVRATDQVGNVGPAAERSFTIASPPPPPPPPDNTAPKVRPKPKSVDVSRSGRFKIRVRCPSRETRCRIALKFRYRGKTVASKSVTVPGGQSARVTLRLKKSARNALQVGGRLKVHAVTTTRDAAGNRATTHTRITLRLNVGSRSAVPR